MALILRITESIQRNISEWNVTEGGLQTAFHWRWPTNSILLWLSRVHDMVSCAVSGWCWFSDDAVCVKIPFLRVFAFPLISSLCYMLITVQEIMLWTLRGGKQHLGQITEEIKKNNQDKIWITILKAFFGLLGFGKSLCLVIFLRDMNLTRYFTDSEINSKIVEVSVSFVKCFCST